MSQYMRKKKKPHTQKAACSIRFPRCKIAAFFAYSIHKEAAKNPC